MPLDVCPWNAQGEIIFLTFIFCWVLSFFFLSILSVSHINTHTAYTERTQPSGAYSVLFFSGVFEIEFRHCIFRVGSGPSDG